jgi:hypothetical protein
LLTLGQFSQTLPDGAAFFRPQEVIVNSRGTFAICLPCRGLGQFKTTDHEGIHADGTFVIAQNLIAPMCRGRRDPAAERAGFPQFMDVVQQLHPNKLA